MQPVQRKQSLPRTPSNQPLLNNDTNDSINPLQITRQPSINNNILSAYEQQKQAIAQRNRSSRTLPLRRSNKKSVTSAARYKLYQQQQKVDGAYCILYETKFDSNTTINTNSLLLNTPQRQRTTTVTSQNNRSIVTTKSSSSVHTEATEDSANDSSIDNSDSSESSDSASSSSDSDSDAVQKPAKRPNTVKKELTEQQLRAKQTYVMNRVGAIFGKSPGIENTIESHLHTRRFTINDNYISKQHFQLRFVHDRFYLWDTASSNGTYLQRKHTKSLQQHNIWTYNQQPSPSVTLSHATLHSTTTTQSTMTLPAATYFVADPVEEYAYLLQQNRAIRIGTIELYVTELIDDDNVDNDQYKLVLTYTVIQSNQSTNSLVIPLNDTGVQVRSIVSPNSGKQYSITINDTGATIGKHKRNNTHCINDTSIAEYHLSIEFINGKFYARNHINNITHIQSTWLRLSPRGIESLPIALYDGDHIRAGSSDFHVSLRSIPQTVTPYTLPVSCIDAGTAVNPNFSVQKEMQDRYVCIDRYGGHEKCMYVAIFDGHQERTVADFAAAALHHNLLQCIEQQMTQSATSQPVSKASTPQNKPRAHTLCVDAHSNLLHTPSNKSPTNRRNTMQTIASQISPLHDNNTQNTRNTTKSPVRLSFRSTSLDAHDITSEMHERSISSTSFMSTNSVDETSPVDTDVRVLYNDTENNHTLQIPQYQSTTTSTTTTPIRSNSTNVKLPSFDMHQAIRDAYAQTAQQIRGMGDASQYGGSTATTCILWHYPETNSTVLYTANLGDSPAILLRGNNTSIRLTQSHVAKDIDEQQRVREAGGKITANNRLAGMLEVTRSFGDLGMESFGLIAVPTISSNIVLSSDIYLIISSDGIFDVISDSDVTTMIESKPLGTRTAHTTAQLLVDTAVKRKTRDNMSVVVIQLQPPATPRPINRPARAYTSEYGSDVAMSGEETDANDIVSPLPSTRHMNVPQTEPNVKITLQTRPKDEIHAHVQRSVTEPDRPELSHNSSQSPHQSPKYLESEPDIDINSPTTMKQTHFTEQHSTPGRLPYKEEQQKLNMIHKKAVDSFSMDDLTQAKNVLSNSPMTTPQPSKASDKTLKQSRSQPNSPETDVSDFDLLSTTFGSSKFSLSNDVDTLEIPRHENKSSRSLLQNNTMSTQMITGTTPKSLTFNTVDSSTDTTDTIEK